MNNGPDKQPMALKPVKDNKHIELHRAVSEMQEVVRRLEELKARVCNAPNSPNDDAEAEPPPSMERLLINEKDIIRNYNQQCHELIDGLNELLF